MKKLSLGTALLSALVICGAYGEGIGQVIDNEAATLGARQVALQSTASAKNYTSSSLTSVTVTETITVPAAQKGILVATFSAESQCTGPSNSWCTVVIYCDDKQLKPVDTSSGAKDFAFNSGSTGKKYFAGSMTRYSAPFTGGTHECEVKTAPANGATAHRLDDWTFKVEFWRQS